MQETREFLASDGVIFQSVINLFFKTPVFDAALTSLKFNIRKTEFLQNSVLKIKCIDIREW